jgi:hypothetical protein
LTDAELEQAYAKSRVQKVTPPRLRFHREIWAAFRDPLRAGIRAAAFRNGHWHIRDVTNVELLDPDEIEISQGDLPLPTSTGFPPTGFEIRSALLAWCEKNSVDVANIQFESSLLQPDGPDRSLHRPRSTLQTGTGAESISFINFLRSLPQKELERVMIPGDVFVSILERLGHK